MRRKQASAGLHSVDWGWKIKKFHREIQYNECNKRVCLAIGEFSFRNNEESIERKSECKRNIENAKGVKRLYVLNVNEPVALHSQISLLK